jgi:tetratricopeptide (TPR) repeat protein
MALKPPLLPNAARRGPSPSELALQSAASAIQGGRPVEAERFAAEVLKANAGSLPALQILGTALVMQGRGKEAIAPLERAARQSRDAATETELAVALRQAGRNEEARERLERAAKRKPPFPPAFLELANLLSALNRHDEAIEILHQGLAIAPDFADLSLELGRVHTARNDQASARLALSRVLELVPRHTDAIFALARVLQSSGEFAQAADMFRRLLEIEPGDAASCIGLGMCLIELGLKDEGMASIRQAAQSSPKMFGEALTALTACGHGTFWLRPIDATRYLSGK